MTITGVECPEEGEGEKFTSSMIAGVVLSVVADCVISVSLSVTKHAHNLNHDPGTNKPKKPYIKIPLWWLGIVLNASGELGNLFAYGFAPASVVTPVGSVGVLCNAFLATCFLKEKLHRKEIVGMFAIMAGVVLIVLGVPASPGTMSVDTLTNEVLPHPRCWGYLIALCFCIAVLRFLAPKYGDKHILVYLMLCSMISSITVIAARAFSSMLTSILPGNDSSSTDDGELSGEVAGSSGDSITDVVSSWLFWVSLIVIIITAIWSVKFLNNAMMLYGNTQVVPLYYCTFTFCSVVGAAIVYNEFACITVRTGLMFGFGCLCAGVGVFLIATGKKDDKADAHMVATAAAEATPQEGARRRKRMFPKVMTRKVSSDDMNRGCFASEQQQATPSPAWSRGRPDTPDAGIGSESSGGFGECSSMSATARLRAERAERRRRREEEQTMPSSLASPSKITAVPFSRPAATAAATTATTDDTEDDSREALPTGSQEGTRTPPYVEEPTTLAELGAALNDALTHALGIPHEPLPGEVPPARKEAPPNTAAVERARRNRAERRMRLGLGPGGGVQTQPPPQTPTPTTLPPANRDVPLEELHPPKEQPPDGLSHV